MARQPDAFESIHRVPKRFLDRTERVQTWRDRFGITRDFREEEKEPGDKPGSFRVDYLRGGEGLREGMKAPESGVGGYRFRPEERRPDGETWAPAFYPFPIDSLPEDQLYRDFPDGSMTRERLWYALHTAPARDLSAGRVKAVTVLGITTGTDNPKDPYMEMAADFPDAILPAVRQAVLALVAWNERDAHEVKLEDGWSLEERGLDGIPFDEGVLGGEGRGGEFLDEDEGDGQEPMAYSGDVLPGTYEE